MLEAKESYLRIIARRKPLPRDALAARVDRPSSPKPRTILPGCWRRVPTPSCATPRQAVEHALRAVDLEPRQGNYWNTLGVAYYRNGQWDEAKDALDRSMELSGEGDSFDWFFLALVHQAGPRAEAQEWYDKAVNVVSTDSSPAIKSFSSSMSRQPRSWGFPSPRHVQRTDL